jgi:hypothetical protein
MRQEGSNPVKKEQTEFSNISSQSSSLLFHRAGNLKKQKFMMPQEEKSSFL